MDDTELFLVRVWQRPQGARAAVQGVGANEAQVFVDPLQLGRYLMQRPADDTDPSPSAADLTREED